MEREAFSKLYGWIELVDATPFKRSNEVYRQLQKITLSLDCCCERFVTSDEGSVLQFELTFWDKNMPNLVPDFGTLCEFLGEDEYLHFEEKSRFGAQHHTLRTILVNNTGVVENRHEYPPHLGSSVDEPE